MDKIKMFICNTFAVLSINEANKYSNLAKITQLMSKGLICVLTLEKSNKLNFAEATIIAIANIGIKQKRVSIYSMAYSVHTTSISAMEELLENIISFTSPLPITVKINTLLQESKVKYDFYIKHGFVVHSKLAKVNTVYLVYNHEKKPNINFVPRHNFSTQIVKFPKHLAYTLSTLAQLDYETGGNICISDSEINDYGETVLVLDSLKEHFHRGSITKSTVSIPLVDLSPFSFHVHPDKIHEKEGVFFGLPSVLDIYSVLSTMTTPFKILAHFVVSQEGIWIIHINEFFQQFITNVYKQTSLQVELKDLIHEQILPVFTKISTTDISYKTTDPANRYLRKQKYFKDINENVNIKNFNLTFGLQNVLLTMHQQTFNLIKIKLLSWENFTTDKYLSFPYYIDPSNNLPEHFKLSCSYMDVN